MKSDIQASTVTGDGVAFEGRARLKGFYIAHAANGGDVVFRDGGASGAVRLTLGTPAAVGVEDMRIPEDGILFETDVHVTVGDATSVTVFVG